MLRRHRTAAILLVTLAVGACRSAPDDDLEWSYRGETGPRYWGELKPEYALARTGRRQSPIDIRPASAVREELAPIEVSYDPTTIDIMNNGHTVEDDYHGGGHLRVDGRDFALAQFHFHAPSEHTVDGRHFPMEIHLVHRDAGGDLAVVAALVEEGEECPTLGELERHFPRERGRAEEVEGMYVSAADLLPDSLACYRYSGSLTTPPCTEGVAWFVLEEPVEASRAQIDLFHEIIGGNNRPTQPLHGRSLTASR